MSKHYLDPLLKPKSIALIGASAKEESPGNQLTRHIIHSEFQGKVYLVNPGYESILATSCYDTWQLAIRSIRFFHIALFCFCPCITLPHLHFPSIALSTCLFYLCHTSPNHPILPKKINFPIPLQN